MERKKRRDFKWQIHNASFFTFPILKRVSKAPSSWSSTTLPFSRWFGRKYWVLTNHRIATEPIRVDWVHRKEIYFFWQDPRWADWVFMRNEILWLLVSGRVKNFLRVLLRNSRALLHKKNHPSLFWRLISNWFISAKPEPMIYDLNHGLHS